MIYTNRWLAALALSLMGSTQALAKPLEPVTPLLINQLLACRSISNPTARLECLDRYSEALSAAISRKNLVVIDREAVHKTRRSLFGLAIPDLGIFGDDNIDPISQIEGAIESARRNADGGYIFILTEGSRWTQIDDRPLALEPRTGDKVVVKKAAMGSYMLSVSRQPGVRVRRIN